MANGKKVRGGKKAIKDLEPRDAKAQAVRGGERERSAPSVSEITISKSTDAASTRL